MTPSAGAQGLQLYKGTTPQWKVGAMLGCGACGTVHELLSLHQTSGFTSDDFAVKIAPLPVRASRKKNTPVEVNASRLYYEHTVYQNQFQSLQGTHIPRLPPKKGPPTYGEISGFRFMVMERMESSLSTVIPRLLLACNGASVPFGPVAVQLLHCVRAIHEHRHIVVDVKPDNFMLARLNTSNAFPKHQRQRNGNLRGNKSSMSVPEELAQRIRILDLALVQLRTTISSSHRPNSDTSGLAGTPLYASLNVHHGQTPSRRDDLESLAYVIAELLMQLSSGGDMSVGLPWKNAKSDEQVGEWKESQVTDPKSEFYTALGTPTVRRTFKKFLDQVRSYSYKQEPDYDALAKILAKLDVPVTAKKRDSVAARIAVAAAAVESAASPESAGGTKRRSTRVTRASAKAAAALESPTKMQRLETESGVIDESRGSESDDEVFEDAQAGSVYYTCGDRTHTEDAMDWDPILDEENVHPMAGKNGEVSVGVTVVVDGGSHDGESFCLVEGQSDSVVIGRNPTSLTPKETTFRITDDNDIDESHVRLELKVTKRLVSVVMTDLKSRSGVTVGNQRIRKTGRVFINQPFQAGSTNFRVKPLSVSKSKPNSNLLSNVMQTDEEEVSTANATVKLGNSHQPTIPKVEADRDRVDVDLTGEPNKPATAKRGVRMDVIEGPHTGDCRVLDANGISVLVVGSKPHSVTGTEEDGWQLSKDTSLMSDHVRLELNMTKRLTAVRVTDLKGGDTMVRDAKLSKGKGTRAFMNDKIRIGDTVIAVKKL